MKKFFISLVVLFIFAGAAIAGEYFLDKASPLDLVKLGPNCAVENECGNFIYVDCDSEVDGPAYYMHKETHEIVSKCGGAMLNPDNMDKCPPEEWINCKEKASEDNE